MERNFVAVCVSCRSEQTQKHMDNSPFERPPCKYCGGVVFLVGADNKDEALERINHLLSTGRLPN